MMRNFIYIAVLILLFTTGSCDLLNIEEDNGLTTEEVIEGLKKALEIGADSATTNLSKLDGYYGNAAVKIFLPDEADIIYDNLNTLDSYIPGGKAIVENKLENLVLAINRSAEDAADDALPVLGNAVTSLTIQDGWDILNGSVPDKNSTEGFDSLAATHYLENQTKAELIVIFSTPMNASLNKPLVGDISAYSLWEDVTSIYNTAVSVYNLIPLVTDLEMVNTDLGQHVTEKAMDGLFYKVGEEEKKIRRDPFQWAIDIIQRVFSYIF